MPRLITNMRSRREQTTIYHSYDVSQQQISFLDQYKMKIAGTLFISYSIRQDEKLPAIIVGHPMGAVNFSS